MLFLKILIKICILLSLLCSGCVGSPSSSSTSIKQHLNKLAPSDNSLFSNNRYNALFLIDYFEKVYICYKRFKQCAKLLNPEFCVSQNKRPSFYIWAKKIAGNIMNGSGIHCPRKMMMQFYEKHH